MDDQYKEKYLKYKLKYTKLKEYMTGGCMDFVSDRSSKIIGVNYQGGTLIDNIKFYGNCVGYANCLIPIDAPYGEINVYPQQSYYQQPLSYQQSIYNQSPYASIPSLNLYGDDESGPAIVINPTELDQATGVINLPASSNILNTGYASPVLNTGYVSPVLNTGYASPVLNTGYGVELDISSSQPRTVVYPGVLIGGSETITNDTLMNGSALDSYSFNTLESSDSNNSSIFIKNQSGGAGIAYNIDIVSIQNSFRPIISYIKNNLSNAFVLINLSNEINANLVSNIYNNAVLPLLTQLGISRFSTTQSVSPANYSSPFVYLNIGLFSAVSNVSQVISNTVYNPVVSFRITDYTNQLFTRDPVPSSFNDQRNILNNINSCPKIILLGLDNSYNWNQLTPTYYPQSGFVTLINNLGFY